MRDCEPKYLKVDTERDHDGSASMFLWRREEGRGEGGLGRDRVLSGAPLLTGLAVAATDSKTWGLATSTCTEGGNRRVSLGMASVEVAVAK